MVRWRRGEEEQGEEPRSLEEEPRSLEEEPRSLQEGVHSLMEGVHSLEEERRSLEEEPRSLQEEPRSLDEQEGAQHMHPVVGMHLQGTRRRHATEAGAMGIVADPRLLGASLT